METFNLKDHWDLFKQGKLAINCETELFAVEFLKYCYDQGIKWVTGNSLLQKINWHDYKNITCYNCITLGMQYCSIDYFKNNKIKIIKFKGIQNAQDKNIKIIYHNNETIVIIKNGKKYFKGVAKCNPEDTYDKEFGYLLAHTRAKAKLLGFKLK